MKKFKQNIVFILILVFGVFFSCQDMNDVHQDFIKEGEIIYSNKVDSLKTYPGKERILISGFLSGAFNVDEVVVTWNNGTEMKSFPYSKSEASTDKLDLMISDVGENTLKFQVYTKDISGNKSVTITLFGTAYGEVYRSALVARSISTFVYSADSNATVTFNPISELTRNTEVKYTNLTGDEVVKVVAMEESTALLEQVNTDKPIMYRTFYVPTAMDEFGVETVIDEFDSNWVEYTSQGSAFNAILDSFTFDPQLGSTLASWENPNNLNLKFNFKVGNSGETDVTSNKSTDSKKIPITENGDQIILVTLTNVYGDSWQKTFTSSALPVVKLDRSAWTIIDFDSQEAGGEGPVSGYVTAVIDGDTGTFWHSQWNGAQPDFPHWFTIDMGAQKTISAFEIFRRKDTDNGTNVHEFYVSNDNITWTLAGLLESKLTDNNGKRVEATPNAVQARYVKYHAKAGNGKFAFLSEFYLYGLE